MSYKNNTAVLTNTVIQYLNVKPNGVYIDCTFGQGEHSRLILSNLGKKGKLYAIDRDPKAVSVAKNIIDSRFSILYGTFSYVTNWIKLELQNKVDGVIFDLGVSLSQLNDSQRGFSFIHNGPLDMRMDPNRGITAYEWLRKASKENIALVLKNFGEEKFYKRIAYSIVKRRKVVPIISTKDLSMIISNAIPVKDKFKHPATRSFQAIRIKINNEIQEIKQALKNVIPLLKPKGRLLVTSFHSLEDREVKKFMRKHSSLPHILSILPITEKQIYKVFKPSLKLIGKIKPSEEEISINPRARSSILRIAEKI